MKLTNEQKAAIDKAIADIEYGEITIKAQGKNSFVDIIVSNRIRLNISAVDTEFNKYKKG